MGLSVGHDGAGSSDVGPRHAGRRAIGARHSLMLHACMINRGPANTVYFPGLLPALMTVSAIRSVDIQAHLYASFLEGRTADVVLRISGRWKALYKLHRVVLIQAVRTGHSKLRRS